MDLAILGHAAVRDRVDVPGHVLRRKPGGTQVLDQVVRPQVAVKLWLTVDGHAFLPGLVCDLGDLAQLARIERAALCKGRGD
jgi:hypothetical protein